MRAFRFGFAVCLTLLIAHCTAPPAGAHWRFGLGWGGFGYSRFGLGFGGLGYGGLGYGGLGYGGLGYGGLGYGGFGYQRVSYGFGGFGGGLSIYSGPAYPLAGSYLSYGYSPLVIPAGSMFGPGPVRQMFLGGGPIGCCPPLAAPANNAPLNNNPLNNNPLNNNPLNNNPLNNNPLNNNPLNNPPPKADQKDEAPRPREANAAARERARKFMEFGDTHFGKQEYRAAYERYKLAAESAPNMVETYLRQGQSLVAVGAYELAARIFKRALRLEPDWTQVNFCLNDVYGKNRFAKTAHLESLAAEAEKNPADADLMLLLGTELLYDGQAKRSVAFFQRQGTQRRGEYPAAEATRRNRQPAAHAAAGRRQILEAGPQPVRATARV